MVVNQHGELVYEVTLSIESAAAAGLDEWLDEHVAAMLELPGFVDAEVTALSANDDREARVVRYGLESREDLDNYLAGPAANMRQQTVDRFGEKCEATRRILYPRQAPAVEKAATPRCLNCDAALTGQYCWRCGQRAQDRLISLWELLKDAFGDLLDADSRLWRTLQKLAFRPGWLTRDYLRGRRVRYMPPFRTYLVLSLLFFVVAFFDPRENLGILFEPEVTAPAAPAEGEAESLRNRPNVRVSVNGDDDADNCDFGDYDPAELPGFLGRRLSRERVQLACERLTADDGQGLRAFTDRMLDFVPAGLFLLLPLMALALKILYPLSRRYYVEHLLLVVHFHAFVFLAMTVQSVLSRAGASLSVPDGFLTAILMPILVYVPVYLYKTLRLVYTQGHWLTTLKFLLLSSVYAAGSFAIFATMALIAAFSA